MTRPEPHAGKSLNARDANEPARLFWTGGWDSTYRLLELLLVYRQRVQPYYVIDPRRASFAREIRTMVTIKKALLEEHPEVAGLLEPVIYAELSGLTPNESITAARARLGGRHHLGSQYDWLHRFAVESGIAPVEVSSHGVERLGNFLDGHLVEDLDDSGPFFRLEDHAGDPDLELFRPFSFPMFNRTKTDLESDARRYGFAHLLERTWFCHRPLSDGSPCGVCYPCIVAMEEGMGRRIPLKGKVRWWMHRYQVWTNLLQPLRIVKRRLWRFWSQDSAGSP